jgi:hypothetical protein
MTLTVDGGFRLKLLELHFGGGRMGVDYSTGMLICSLLSSRRVR